MQDIVHPFTTLPFGFGVVRFFMSPRQTGKPDVAWVAIEDVISSMNPSPDWAAVVTKMVHGSDSPARPYLTKISTDRGDAWIIPAPCATGLVGAFSDAVAGTDIVFSGIARDFVDIQATAYRCLLPGRSVSDLAEYVRSAMDAYSASNRAQR